MVASIFDLFGPSEAPLKASTSGEATTVGELPMERPDSFKKLVVDKNRSCHATFSRAEGVALLAEFRAIQANLPAPPLRSAMDLECSSATAVLVPEVFRSSRAREPRIARVQRTTAQAPPESASIKNQTKAAARMEAMRVQFRKQHSKQEKSCGFGLKKPAVLAASMLMTLLGASNLGTATASLSRSSMLPVPSRVGIVSRGGSSITDDCATMLSTNLPDINSLQTDMVTSAPAKAECSAILTDILIAAKVFLNLSSLSLLPLPHASRKARTAFCLLRYLHSR